MHSEPSFVPTLPDRIRFVAGRVSSEINVAIVYLHSYWRRPSRDKRHNLLRHIGPSSSSISVSMLTTCTRGQPTDQPLRSNIFFYMGGSVLAAELASSPLAVALMNIDPWLPIFLGFLLYVPGLLVAYCLPETLNLKATDDVPSDLTTEGTAPGATTVWREFGNGLRGLRSATVFFIWGNRQVVALLSTILLTTLGRHAQDILLQFARRRYGWSWGQVSR